MRKINYELYKVFYNVANKKSLTAVAKDLYLSQPAISQSIKQLEKQLGTELLIRHNSGVELTKQGVLLYEYVKEAVVLFDLGEKRLEEFAKKGNKELSISASDTFTKYFLLDKIREFNFDYPDVNFKITNSTTKESIELLKNTVVDIAFVNGPIKSDLVDSKNCIEYQNVFVISNSYGKIDKTKVYSIEDISFLDIIAIDGASSARVEIEKFFRANKELFAPNMDIGSYQLILDMVKMGMGVGFLPDFMVKYLIKEGKVFKLNVDFKLPTKRVDMVTLKNNKLPDYVDKFKHMFLEV